MLPQELLRQADMIDVLIVNARLLQTHLRKELPVQLLRQVLHRVHPPVHRLALRPSNLVPASFVARPGAMRQFPSA